MAGKARGLALAARLRGLRPGRLRVRAVAVGCCALVVTAFSAGAGSASAASSAYVAELETEKVTQFGVGIGGALAPLLPENVAAGEGPFAIAISPDAKSLYVTDVNVERVSQFDISPGGGLVPKSPASVPVPGGMSPNSIAVSPDGHSVYVTSSSGSVSQYDVGAGGVLSPKVVPTVAAGPKPSGVAVTPDGRSAYVTNFAGGTVSQYDVGPNGELTPKSPATVPGGSSPSDIAITPDGHSVYVSDVNGFELSQYEVGANGALSPMSPATVASGHFSQGIAVSPDGRYAYVADESGNVIEQYSIAPNGALTRIAGAPTAKEGPVGIAISPDGKSLYTTVYYGNLLNQYDIGAGGALSPKSPATVATEEHPWGIAVLPDAGPVAAVAAHPGTTGSASTFDASASAGPAAIARYDWSFGDGSGAADGGATPAHVYAAPGTYVVTLTVTDADGCSTAQVFTGHTAYCGGSTLARTSLPITVLPVVDVFPATLLARPVISAARQSASRWREGNRLAQVSRHKPPVGTVFSFSLNEQASVRFVFSRQLAGRRVRSRCVPQSAHNRHRKPCRRTVLAGGLALKGHAGTNRVRFQGRLSQSKRLRPGAYTLTITATDAAGARSAPVTLRFTIVR
jgi:DNA-binding beta-propeller fold protein YncE